MNRGTNHRGRPLRGTFTLTLRSDPRLRFALERRGDDTTLRRSRAPSAHSPKAHKVHEEHKVGVEYQRFSRWRGHWPLRPVLAGVRDGWITSSRSGEPACDPAGPHSCHRAKRGPASGESQSKRLTRFSLCHFVTFVVFMKSAEGATVWNVVSSSRPSTLLRATLSLPKGRRSVVNAAEGRTRRRRAWRRDRWELK
jgi:hypothetical protein